MKTNSAVLERLIPLADAHQAADEYLAGVYWNAGQGCALGCTVHDAVQLGLLQAPVPPETLACFDFRRLEEITGVPARLGKCERGCGPLML